MLTGKGVEYRNGDQYSEVYIFFPNVSNDKGHQVHLPEPWHVEASGDDKDDNP